MSKKDEAWSTNDELAYINNIGSSELTEGLACAGLSGYLQSAGVRVDWGAIDAKVCIARAKKLLSTLKARS